MKVPGGNTLSTVMKSARIDINCTAIMPLYLKVHFELDSGALGDDDDAAVITAAVRYQPATRRSTAVDADRERGRGERALPRRGHRRAAAAAAPVQRRALRAARRPTTGRRWCGRSR